MLKIIWRLLLIFIGLILGGAIYYARFFYPFHVAIACSIILFIIIHASIGLFSSKIYTAGISFFLAGTIVIISITFGARSSENQQLSSSPIPEFQTPPPGVLDHAFKAITFPAYKSLMKQLSDIKMGPSGYQISKDQIQQIKTFIKPGDIILLRKNNYLSNWLIRGFWKHAALYCGSLDQMDHYFIKTSEEALNSRLSKYLFKHVSPSYDVLFSEEALKDNAVIESTSRGVNIQSLDTVLKSDYLAILRPRLPKRKKMLAIIYALSQFQKPYDFEFEFSDDRAFCCSELIFKAFYPYDGNGLTSRFHMISGRPIIVPNDFVKEFDHTFMTPQCQYDFVLYLDGRNRIKNNPDEQISSFRSSWKKGGI